MRSHSSGYLVADFRMIQENGKQFKLKLKIWELIRIFSEMILILTRVVYEMCKMKYFIGYF